MSSGPTQPHDETEEGGTAYLVPAPPSESDAKSAAETPATLPATPALGMSATGPFPSDASAVQDTTVSGAGDSRKASNEGLWGSGSQIPINIQPGLVLFDRFIVEKKLGQGGMGDVWLVRHKELEVHHALKMIVANIASDEQIRLRFRREARLMANLKHRNAVVVHDARMAGDAVFIDMEYVQGKSINTLLKGGVPMPLDWVENVLSQLCDVLQVAHDQGIVHRDLKPTNLMLVDGGEPGREELKVLDFGIAKLITPEGTQDDFRTNPGQFIGTPQYSSPEQIDEGSTDHRSDIYSVGIILYEFFTGHRPFSGGKVLMDHLMTPPPAFHEKNKATQVPPEVERVVLRCLAKNPDDRPQSARDLKAEFLAAVHTGSTDGSRTQNATGVIYASGTQPKTQEATGPGSGSQPGGSGQLSGGLASGSGNRSNGVGLLDTEQATGTLLVDGSAVDQRRPIWTIAAVGLLSLVAAAAIVIPRWVPPSADDFAKKLRAEQGFQGYEPFESKGKNGWPFNLIREEDNAKAADAPKFALTDRTLEDGRPVYLPEFFEPEGSASAGMPAAIVRKNEKLPEGEDRMRLILIPGGTFMQGEINSKPGAKGNPDGDRPAHPVTVSDVYFQESEVTNGQFLDYLAAKQKTEDDGPAIWRGEWKRVKGKLTTETARRIPATGVPREDAEKFARWLGGRLPTEAEWEYAARSRGQDRQYVSGNDLPERELVNLDNAGSAGEQGALEVKKRAKDRTDDGIYDLTGNVREITLDAWAEYDPKWNREMAPFLDDPAKARKRDDRSTVVVRGGSYQSKPQCGKTTYRHDHVDDTTTNDLEDIGFRIVIEPIPKGLPAKPPASTTE